MKKMRTPPERSGGVYICDTVETPSLTVSIPRAKTLEAELDFARKMCFFPRIARGTTNCLEKKKHACEN
jgi:hypothetical protein